MATLAHVEPIVDELERVRVRNERVSRVKDIVHGLWPLVEKQVADVVDTKDPMAALNEDQNAWRPEMNRRAQDEWGLQYLAYTRLKLRSVVNRFANVTARRLRLPGRLTCMPISSTTRSPRGPSRAGTSWRCSRASR